jgi:polyisoprenyl-teichoic acid--peptidoglycan teichoic acid transferase
VSPPRSTLRVWARIYAIALVIALTVTVGGLVGVNVVIDRKINSIERVENLDLDENTDPGEPANFLLIGSDTRAFVENEVQEETFGDEASTGGQRSDTLMIVHVDPDARTGLLVSFPRDLLVEIPGVGTSKINAAFNQGPQKVVDTIESNFDVPVHHYLEIDFASFEGIVNAVGGVPVFFPAPGRDKVTGFEIGDYFGWLPGCHELNGTTALAYVRARSYEQLVDGEWEQDPTADIGRIERQQAFMRRLATEAVRKSLANPLAANRIADKSLAELKADEGLSRGDVNKLIQAFRRVDPNDPNSIEMVTVPFEGSGADLELDEELAAPLLARLRELAPPPAPAEGPSPATIRVRVFNGSGVNGAAAQTSAALQDQGFQSGGTGNNPDGNVGETQVRYRPGSEGLAEVVKGYLGGVGELVADDSIVEADVLLVIGSDFDGVTAPAGGAPAGPATTAAPAPSASPPASTPADGKRAAGDETGQPATAC